jgi:hypothetical protein
VFLQQGNFAGDPAGGEEGDIEGAVGQHSVAVIYTCISGGQNSSLGLGQTAPWAGWGASADDASRTRGEVEAL